MPQVLALRAGHDADLHWRRSRLDPTRRRLRRRRADGVQRERRGESQRLHGQRDGHAQAARVERHHLQRRAPRLRHARACFARRLLAMQNITEYHMFAPFRIIVFCLTLWIVIESEL